MQITLSMGEKASVCHAFKVGPEADCWHCHKQVYEWGIDSREYPIDHPRARVHSVGRTVPVDRTSATLLPVMGVQVAVSVVLQVIT